MRGVLRRALSLWNYFLSRDKTLAKEVFASAFRKINCSVGSVDYMAAEAVCPNGIQIGKLMT